MSRLDPFTTRRLKNFLTDFREKSGQLPTLQDFAKAGFPEATIDVAIKDNLIEKFYVTLTNGSIVKGYKLKS